MGQVLKVQQSIGHMESVKQKIEAKSVSFGYQGVEILKHINLDVKEGEFLVLMGPSGCGKVRFSD